MDAATSTRSPAEELARELAARRRRLLEACDGELEHVLAVERLLERLTIGAPA